MARFKGIIFDLDGTLANTFLDFAQICHELNLPQGTPLLEYCAQLEDPQQVQHILSVIEHHEIEGAHRAEWILDAQSTLNEFKQAGLPMAIVTRNGYKAASLTLNNLQIPIDLLLTRDDCLPKPHPEGLLMVAEKWQLPPSELIYVGDYRFDIIASNRARIHACLLLTKRNREFSALADSVIENFSQLKQLLTQN